MKKVGIDDGKTSIVGHSLGGYFAAEVAIENRALVATLVLIDSSGLLVAPTPLLEQYQHVPCFLRMITLRMSLNKCCLILQPYFPF